MNRTRLAITAAGMSAAMATAGAAGAVVFGPMLVSAASPTPGTGATSATPAPSGAPHSNEDTTHEGTESAAQETAEDSGLGRAGMGHGGAKRPGAGMHGSNEDSAHEATESSARETEENARGAAPAPGSSPSPQ